MKDIKSLIKPIERAIRVVDKADPFQQKIDKNDVSDTGMESVRLADYYLYHLDKKCPALIYFVTLPIYGFIAFVFPGALHEKATVHRLILRLTKYSACP